MDLVEKTSNHRRHPWELSRSFCVLKFLKNNNHDTIYADIGSGDKFFASQLRKLTSQNIYTIDIAYPDEVANQGGLISLNHISKLEDSSIDYFIVMDVLEHIEKDQDFLNLIYKKLKPGGRILITVPALQFLFSSHDVFLKHYRRYSRKQISSKIKDGFVLERCFYFYSSLLLLRVLLLVFEALTQKKVKNVGVGLWKYEEMAPITRFFFILLNLDFWFCKTLDSLNIHIPGLSLLAIAKKK